DDDGLEDDKYWEEEFKKAVNSSEEMEVVARRSAHMATKKSRIPPGQFLRAAVRPFTYKNLVKEIVLTRHAIVEGEIGGGKKK
nr:hypothetical protein [Tanacetum cinerariifolium]